MGVLPIFVLTIHYLLVGVLCVYGGHRMYHTFLARRFQAREPLPTDNGFEPLVTVQIPVFNERFVVERLIDAVVALDYPKHKLQIQVLDDSTDDSVDIAARRVAYHKNLGVNIEHIRRTDRKGYKAGALGEAMDQASGEFIAIFDADFMPDKDFLKNAVHHFNDPKIGMVQTRWHYLNTDHNVLTRVQSIMLDAHFGVEQVVRSRTGAFFNFNGTAGIWRREAIIEAGGWCADTITEDLDLSYRAQLKGWKFVYLRDQGCMSELPIDMCAFKTQQHRWAKGAIEVMKKMLVTVWKSPASLHAKVEATFHLTGNFSYMVMFFDSLFLLLPSVHIREQAGWSMLLWLDIPIFLLASLSHAYFFLYSQKLLYGNVWKKITILPALLATSIGLGINNGRAVIEALVGHVTGFVRTPKTGSDTTNTSNSPVKAPTTNTYRTFSVVWADYLEVALGVFYFSYLIWAISKQYYVVVPFLALFSAGFFYTGYQSIKTRAHQKQLARV